MLSPREILKRTDAIEPELQQIINKRRELTVRDIYIVSLSHYRRNGAPYLSALRHLKLALDYICSGLPADEYLAGVEV